MESNGVYNEAAVCQMDLVVKSQTLLSVAIDRFAQTPRNRTLHVADLGASQGRNSMALLATVLHCLQSHFEPSTEYFVWHEDQPSNDFATLLATLHGPSSYLMSNTNVFSGIVSKSFYERLFPSASIDIFLSYIAMHWLSAIPAPLPNNMVFWKQPGYQAQLESDYPEIYSMWFQAAHRDLVAILSLRAIELADHGAMCLTLVSDDGDERTRYYILPIARALQKMAAQNLLSRATLQNMSIACYYRSSEEVKVAIAAVPELTLYEMQHIVLPFSFQTADSAAAFFLSIFKPSIVDRMTPEERKNPHVISALSSLLIEEFDQPLRVDGHATKENIHEEPFYKNVSVSYLFVDLMRQPREK
jgi:hypothetical protein